MQYLVGASQIAGDKHLSPESQERVRLYRWRWQRRKLPDYTGIGIPSTILVSMLVQFNNLLSIVLSLPQKSARSGCDITD